MPDFLLIPLVIIAIMIVFAVLFKLLIPVDSNAKKDNSLEEVNPAQVISKAHSFYEMGQLSKAINILEEFTKKYPDFINVRFLLGDYLVEKNLPSKAEKHYRHIIKLDPTNKDALERISDCYYLLGKYEKALDGYLPLAALFPDDFDLRIKIGDIYVKTNDYEAAIKEYRMILSKDHYNVDVKKKLADLFYVKGDYRRAINEYEDILKVDGISINILKRLARCHYNSDSLADAALVYKRMIDHDDSDPVAYSELADIYMKIKKYDKAAKTYSILIEKGFDISPKMMNKLANIYILSEEYARAVSIANNILKEDPEYMPALETLSTAYLKLKKYENAVHACKKLIEENPDKGKKDKYKNITSSILCEWGNEFFLQKDYQAALDKFIDAIQYDLKNPEVYLNLGRTNHAIRNYEAAISHFNKALELADSNPDIYLNIAQIYEEIDQINAAIDLYYDAVKKYPNNFELRQALGISLGTAGYYPQAETELCAAAEINPKSSNIYYNLGLVYELQDKYEEAKENYKKTLDLDPNHEEARNNFSLLRESNKESEVTENNQEI